MADQEVDQNVQDARANKRKAALKFAEDGRPATLAAMGDDRRDLNHAERIKLEKPGPKVWEDVVTRYAEGGYASIDPDDFDRFKWIGVYRQRPNDGYFMLRIKLVGGQASNEQMRVFAGITRDYARGVADITTRQTFQMHWLTIDMFPDIMERLGTVGLGVNEGLFGACGDICRNIVSSPIAGLDSEEIIDPTPIFQEANKYFSNHPDFADLPRKFKVGMFGHRSAGQCEINCVAFYGTRRADGSVGFGLMVGGGLSTEPHLSQDFNVFVQPEQVIEVLEAIASTYRDHGYRKNRKHARLKYLVADWGVDKFRAEIEKLVGYALLDAEPQAPVKGYQDKLGVFPQKQAGLSFVGVPVVAGRMTDSQMFAVADLAQEFGTGDVRLTVMQNFYIINVPNEKIGELLARLDDLGFPVEASPVRRGIVACTGIEFCNLAVTETKARAANIVQLLDQGVKWTDTEFFRINVNGCPNSCGQHWIADVGLQGCTKTIDGQKVEQYDVFLGGTLGTDARFNRRIKRLPAEEVAPAVQKLIGSYEGSRESGESFADWVARHSDEELEVLF